MRRIFIDGIISSLTLLVLSTIQRLCSRQNESNRANCCSFWPMLYSTLKIMLLALVAVPLFADYFQNCLRQCRLARCLTSRNHSVGGRGAVLASLLLLLPLGPILRVNLISKVYLSPHSGTVRRPGESRWCILKAKGDHGKHLEPKKLLIYFGGSFLYRNCRLMPPSYIDGRTCPPVSHWQIVKEYVGMILGVTDWQVPLTTRVRAS